MTSIHTGRFALLRGSVVELPKARPLIVTSAGGTLWLTLDNDPRDLLLSPGEQFLLEVKGRVLAYALEEAVLELRDVQQPMDWPTLVTHRAFTPSE